MSTGDTGSFRRWALERRQEEVTALAHRLSNAELKLLGIRQVLEVNTQRGRTFGFPNQPGSKTLSQKFSSGNTLRKILSHT